MAQHAQDDQFGPDYWEDRYRRGGAGGRPAPSPALRTEAAGLAPGRALDAGCGRGADAVWLAEQGWQVTAVDVSATALAAGRQAGRAAGPGVAGRVEWVCADLIDWAPGERRFDLVTASYVHLPGSMQDLVGRLASWVAPSGTLLVVGHAEAHPAGARPAGARPAGARPTAARPPAAEVRADQLTGGLPRHGWQVVVAEPRTHVVRRPDGGTTTLHDVVLRALRS